jgi:uncharacterized protein
MKFVRGQWAMVLGGAEGVGEGLSEALALQGLNLLLADYNQAAMEERAEHLRKTCGIEVRTLYIDLSLPDSPVVCLREAEALNCRTMVYVAAFSRVKPFLDLSEEEIERFLSVNNRSLILMVHAFASRLARTGGGSILLVSSLSGVVAPPLVPVYAASKAFIIRLAESLFSEFREKGIAIGCCTLGIIETPTFLATGPVYGLFKPPVTTPASVARYSLRKLGKKPVFTPSFANRASYFLLTRLLPRKVALALVGGTMKKMYRNKSN